MLKTDYNNAVNRIKADDEFKARLIKKLDAEQKKLNTSHKTITFRRYIPAISGLVAALVLTLAVFASKNVILPLISPELDPEQAYTGKNEFPRFEREETADNDDAVIPEPSVSSEVTNDNTFDVKGESVSVEQDTAYTESNNMDAVDSTGSHYRISFSTANDVPIKGLSSAGELINYDMTLHFEFKGFDEYGISLSQTDVIFRKSLPKDYNIADLLHDHYNIIIGDLGKIEMHNGLLDIFLDIRASDTQPINVYADGLEILNLETALMSDYINLSDVYFVISAT